MKSLSYFLILFFLSSCTTKTEQNYIVKFDNKEVNSAEFINKLMVLGFIKHGPSFYTKIYDSQFFEEARSETLEHIIGNFFYNSLSQKYEIKVTDSELESWIQSRTPDLKQEDLLYTLEANNLSLQSWRTLFREQLIQHKVVEALSSAPDTESQKKEKEKNSDDDGLLMATITFENAVEAKEMYQKIAKNKIKFDEALANQSNISTYSWVKTDELPFFSKIKYLSKNRVSKPIETKWGHLLVQIKKRGKVPLPKRDTASGQIPASIKPLLEEFKKNPKLMINTDLLYSLKIKK
jgi:hypothetical protein